MISRQGVEGNEERIQNSECLMCQLSVVSKIKRVGKLQNYLTVGVVRSSRLIENQEQIISGLVDPVQSKIETEKILDVVVLKRDAGEPIIGWVVVDAEVA